MTFSRKIIATLLLGNVVSISGCYYFWQQSNNNRHEDSYTCNKNVLKSQLLTMAEYNKWTYSQIQNWCKQNFKNNEDLYNQNTNIPFKTVRNTLCHLWCGDQLWYCLMNGIYDKCGIKNNQLTMNELATFWDSDHENDGKWQQIFDSMSIDEIFNELNNSSNRWIEFIQSFENDEDLNTDFYFHYSFDSEAMKRKRNRVFIITHILNHGTHHRGQISGALTQLCNDAKPIELDLGIWNVYYRNK
eukprot:496813_1